MKKPTIYLLTICSFFLSVTNTYCQRPSNAQVDSIKYWCSQKDGIKEVEKILDKFNREGRKLQAAALKISYEELLSIDAETQCKLLNNELETTNFTFDTSGRRKFKYYNWYNCQAKWDGSCEADEDLILPAGWQVCSIEYNITSKRGNADNPEFTPINYYEGDSEYPYRFRGYHMKLRSSGNNEFLNRVGANIALSDIAIIAIPSNFTNEDRYKLGCVMPKYPVSKPKISTAEETDKSNETDVEVIPNWSYDIKKVGDKIHVSWKSRPYSRLIRVHSTRNFNPYKENLYNKNNIIILDVNQWCEMKLPQGWSYMSGADNRQN